MPLNKQVLADQIKAAFDAAGKSPPSMTPDQVSKQLAASLAAAIEAYVKGGDVSQISVSVVAPDGTTAIGTGKQTGVGKVV